jgi:hypothetical protein
MSDKTYNYSTTNLKGYEVCYFRNICNEIIPYPVDGLDYLPISNGYYYIAQEDIILYTTVKGEYNLCPIPYTIDTINNKIIPKNPAYKKHKLYYGSRNQFIYKRIPIKTEVMSIPIPYAFRSGYNPNNYFIFLNGRLMNSAFYKIMVPSLDNSLIDQKIIYFTSKLTPQDTLDVFYISNNSFNRMNGSGDLVIRPFKIKATEPIQRKFLIPSPYAEYPVHDYNSFIVICHGVRMSPDRYHIVNEDNKYYIEFADVDDYLIYDDDLVFLFPYYRADWETTDALSKHNTLNFITTYKKIPIDTVQIEFDATSLGDINNGNSVYVFVGTKLLDSKEYRFIAPNKIHFDHVVPANTEVAVVIESDRSSIAENNAFVNYVNLPVITDGQWALQLPFSDNPKSYIFFRKGQLIPQSHYSIVNNQFILGRNYNNLHAGETITAIYTTDGSDSFNNVNFHSYEMVAKEDDQIQIPNEVGLRYSTSNLFVFINNGFVSPSHYTVAGNTLKFKEKNILTKDDDINIFLLYKTINSLRVPYKVSDKDKIQFIERHSTAEENDQKTYEIPYPDKDLTGYTDAPFMVFLRGIFIPQSSYTQTENKDTGKNYITFVDDMEVIKKDDQIDFVFCYTPGYTTISKREFDAELTYDENSSVKLPYIYLEPVDLSERVMFFYGGSYIDETRYTLDRHNRTVTFKDLPYEGDKKRIVTAVFFYTGNSNTGTVGYIPQSGYIYFDDHQIDRNLNNEMLMIFVNGLLVPKSNVYDISNSIKKVTRNLKTRYDLNIINCSPLVTEFKRLYDPTNNAMHYTVNVVQTPNQKLTITSSLTGKKYNTSFITQEKDNLFVTIEADTGYKPGIIQIDGLNTYFYSNLNKDITITAKPAALVQMYTVTIEQSPNQTISVLCNGKTYVGTFKAPKGSKFTVRIDGSRDGYVPGTLNMTSGTVNGNVIVKANPATVKTFTMKILDINLQNQIVQVSITDPTGHVDEFNAPCTIEGVKYGSQFKFTSMMRSGYQPSRYIGPFMINKIYHADYRYPLDNLIAEPPKKIVKRHIKLYPAVNETLFMNTWSSHDDTNKIRHEAKADTDVLEFDAADGEYYELGSVADYGYIAGDITCSTGELAGVIESDITAAIEEAVTFVPMMIVTRDHQTSSQYTIQVSFGDGYQDVNEGIYMIRPGTTYICRAILHNEVVFKTNGIMPNKNMVATIKPNGTITVEEGVE